MRPSVIFLALIGVLAMVDSALFLHRQQRQAQSVADSNLRQITVASLGLTDLSLATEARYTRHPAVTDPMVPFMGHPGAFEHFPSGSFWTAPSVRP